MKCVFDLKGFSIRFLGYCCCVDWSRSYSAKCAAKRRHQVVTDFGFLKKASAVVAWSPQGGSCPDGVSDGNDLVIEVFHTPIIEGMRVPTDGEHFLALLICLPEDSIENATQVLSLPTSSTDQQLQRGQFSKVYFAHPRCLYPKLDGTQTCKVTLNDVQENSMSIHIDAKLAFYHLGDLIINRTFQFKKGFYGGVPMSVRARLH